MFKITNKHKQALALAMRDETTLEIFEGTVRSSKTVCAITAFALRVLNSHDTTHLIAARDLDAVTNNILESNGYGLLSMYPGLFQMSKGKIGSNYIAYKNNYNEEGKILIAGYDKKNTWEKVLGNTIGCILVDEVNIADEQFIDECFARQMSIEHPFTIWTLNGDNPDHYIYKKYINYAKPLGKVPEPILKEMDKFPNKQGYYYIHWNMHDNPIMTEEKIQRASSIYPIGSYYYNIKILGIRGKAEGTIFADSVKDTVWPSGHIRQLPIPEPSALRQDAYADYEIGIDIGNNEIKRGTVITISGFDADYKNVHVLKYKECTATEINALVNEMAVFVRDFAMTLLNRGRLKHIWLDSYGPIQLMLSTFKAKLEHMGLFIPVDEVPKFGKDQGRKARLEMLLILIGSKRITFTPECSIYLNMLSRLVYSEDGLPLDDNQIEMDYYDSLCYTFVNNILKLNKI